MPTIIASNALLQARATSLRSLLNSGHLLCLFRSPTLISPATTLAGLVECNFTGYAPFNLAGVFSAPNFVKDGLYQLTMAGSSFTCTALPAQDVYGWFIRDVATLKLSGNFASPITVTTGSVLSFQVFPQTWDKLTP